MSDMTPLPRIVEKYESPGVECRLSLDSLTAKFSTKPEHQGERGKIEKIIKMLAREHLKGFSQAVKLLSVGVAAQKHGEVMATIQDYMTTVATAADGLAEHRCHIVDTPAKPTILLTDKEEEGED